MGTGTLFASAQGNAHYDVYFTIKQCAYNFNNALLKIATFAYFVVIIVIPWGDPSKVNTYSR